MWLLRAGEFADRQNAGDRHWLDDGSAGVELRDAQVDGFFGEAERLENRFQWINIVVVDFAE